MTDVKRNESYKINELLKFFPVVAILGARQVGKTSLAKVLRPDWDYFDLEKPSDLAQIEADPELFFKQFPSNIIIDEAQSLPKLFPILRGIIDQSRDLKGRFILTGSSSPDLLNNISETLAGRIATVELGTLKANEIYKKPLSPFYEIFQTKLDRKSLAFSSPPLDGRQIHQAWFKGGYPEPVLQKNSIFYYQWMENYHRNFINRDIIKLFPKINRLAFQRFLAVITHLSGNILNKAELARDIEVSQSSVKEYLKIAEGTFLWRQLLSYEKQNLKSVVKMPKGHMCDSGLLHYLLKLPDEKALYENRIVGRSFEGFVIEEIIKGLNSTMITNWQSHYYRTRGGAEVDSILEGPFGILPIEIKYGVQTQLKRLQSLQKFIEQNKLAFGLLINQSDRATWLTDTIFQLPAGWI